MRPTRSRSWFTRFTKWTAKATGRPLAFTVAVFVIAAWAITGPIFGFSDTWQLIINTTTTILTNLIVFLIQNTQNRDTAALQLQLCRSRKKRESWLAHHLSLSVESPNSTSIMVMIQKRTTTWLSFQPSSS